MRETDDRRPFDLLETDLGGRGRDFGTTMWSRLQSPDGNPYPALRHLAERYWKPLYCFIRAHESCGNERAKDLTQEFFLWIMETGFLAKLRRDAGRFRGFLKVALANFLTDRRRAAAAAKRGGLRKVLSLDEIGDAAPPPDRPKDSPEAVLDRRWREALVDRALQELDRSFGPARAEWVKLWRDYDLSPEAGLDHEALAARYAVTLREVSYRLTRVRARFREILVGLVAQTVTDEESLARELRDLFGDDASQT